MTDDCAAWICPACLSPMGVQSDGNTHMALGWLNGVDLPMHPECANTLRGIA